MVFAVNNIIDASVTMVQAPTDLFTFSMQYSVDAEAEAKVMLKFTSPDGETQERTKNTNLGAAGDNEFTAIIKSPCTDDGEYSVQLLVNDEVVATASFTKA